MWYALLFNDKPISGSHDTLAVDNASPTPRSSRRT